MRPIGRRAFLAQSTTCAAHLALVASFAPLEWRGRWAGRAHGAVDAVEPFGRLERVADGVWALISTPFGGDRTTISNGGLIAGTNGVLAIEGFNTTDGARWLASRSRELTGRWPTHVVITHYHADHANGVAGYVDGEHRPVVQATAATRDAVIVRNLPADASRTAALQDAVAVSMSDASRVDLGGRTVTITPAGGHTASDVTVEVTDPGVLFCGDLVWNGMFPNFVDATPTVLDRSVRALRRRAGTVYVPGHGAVAGDADFSRYVAMLGEIGEGARRAHAAGLSPAAAGASYALPVSLGEWALFNKVFYERAFAAWYRELGD